MVAPGHDGALLCLLSPTPCVLLWLLLLTLQLFFYTWHNPLSPASQVCSSCVIGFTSSLKYCLGPPLFAWRNLVSGTVDGQNPAPPHHFTLEGSHSNPRAPSFNVGVTPLRRWCRILDLQLVFVFSLWWPQCWRDPSEEVVQDFGPSTCFCFLTVVAPSDGAGFWTFNLFLFSHCGGVTPLRRWCRILDLQLVFVFSLWWPQC